MLGCMSGYGNNQQQSGNNVKGNRIGGCGGRQSVQQRALQGETGEGVPYEVKSNLVYKRNCSRGAENRKKKKKNSKPACSKIIH